ncbi:hypothetical protein LTR56_026767 [Elasticomyces elasticus]|nr:hypothetical protein LTR56_026767 [Elasticomyces elasticus]KAK3617605.1 hypothetical protein LTR22_026683 [Elasticomyces elasticus]
MSGPTDVLREGFAETGEFSDFEIVCGPYTFKVHKAIICAQSKYFRAPCSKFAESDKRTIELKAIGDGEGDEACDDPDAIKLMIDFFYNLDYVAEPLEPSPVPRRLAATSAPSPLPPEPDVVPSVLESQPVEDASGFYVPKRTKKKGKKAIQAGNNTVMHAKVFAAAVKYQVFALQELAATKFASATETSWNHTKFAEAARIAYTTTVEEVRELRDAVGRAIHEHPELLDKLSIETAVKDNAALNYELLRMARGMPAIAENRVIDEGLKCAECGTWLFYEECNPCKGEYRGCCGTCSNPNCLLEL